MFLSEFTGFHGLGLALVTAAGLTGAVWLALLAWRWLATFPYLPDAHAATDVLGEEPPAIVNFLVHRWRVTQPAMAATMLDLAARGLLAIEQYGDEVVVRLYEERISGEQLNGFERQILGHVRSRVRGRSAPIGALELGEQAQAFWTRFRGLVEDEAKAGRLTRSRWTNEDRAILGGVLAAALGLLALSFGTAHVGHSNSEDDIGTVGWLVGAGALWVFINGYVFTRRNLRDTPAGLATCSRWLGVREYFRESGTFGDVPAAASTIWGRHLAYGVALGVAHQAARELPFNIDDPDTAWSRHGGDWHELHVDYPARFGAMQRPVLVVLHGLWQSALFGGLAFVALPIVAQVAWDVGTDVLESSGTGGEYGNIRYLIIGLVAFFAVAGLFLLFRFAVGLTWLVRGLMDLARTEAIEGEVVKRHAGRVAVDPGHGEDEIVAWVPPPGSPGLELGMIVRIEKTRRLHYVSSVEVLPSAFEST